MPEYIVSLYHGEGNKEKTTETIKANHAKNAVDMFMQKHFPNECFFVPGRYENPITYSFGNTVSGQRIYVKEVY